MAITSQPFVQLTSFNFWPGAIDGLYLLDLWQYPVHKISVTGPLVPASALIDNTAHGSTEGAHFAM